MFQLLDLFSGIGGFSLGLERSGGFRTIAFCEIEPFCRKVLKKHWPDVPCYEDVRELTAAKLRADGIVPDAICGGFPCQDISVAGKGAGIAGERSGLWSEYARIIGELRPKLVIVENVAALLGRGLSRVLGDLAALGFDAEWHCIPASSVGAPHRRDRLWIVANAIVDDVEWWRSEADRGDVAASRDARRAWQPDRTNGIEDVADANEPRLEGWISRSLQECAEQRFAWAGDFQGWDEARWFAESGMGRVSNGTANRVDRLRALGNAVVPQIPELIGRAILEAEGRA